METDRDLSVVTVGCRVQVRDPDGLLSWYRLLGGQRGAGWVPVYSALGVALLGKRVGDRVLPRGTGKELEILAVAAIGEPYETI
jgi:transcription elongation GreA/GreB family factor